jgi:hypothetical protein
MRVKIYTFFSIVDGSLQVSDGGPAICCTEIAATSQSFMTSFPDLIDHFDGLVKKPENIEFHSTLTGSDADPAGNGHQVKVSGFGLWTMCENGRIKKSSGTFSV